MAADDGAGDPREDRDDREERVARTLAQLRAGVRQRRGELATLSGGAAGSDEARQLLLEVERLEFVREPTATSPRPGVGRLLVFARKAFFHLFHKWYARPLLHQQNELNRALGQLGRELAAGQEELAAALDRLAARLATLEARISPVAGSGPEAGDDAGADPNPAPGGSSPAEPP